jgi:hypothetical protein
MDRTRWTAAQELSQDRASPLTPRRASRSGGRRSRRGPDDFETPRSTPRTRSPFHLPGARNRLARDVTIARPRQKNMSGPSFRPRGGGGAHAGEAPSSRGSTLRARCPHLLAERRRSRSCLCAAPAVDSESQARVPSPNPKSLVPSDCAMRAASGLSPSPALVIAQVSSVLQARADMVLLCCDLPDMARASVDALQITALGFRELARGFGRVERHGKEPYSDRI